MLHLTLRSLVANKIRFALTTIAVVLGVSFVASSFVLSDGLRRTFGDLSTEIVGGVDYQVRPVADFGTAEPLDASVLDLVTGVDGVRSAAGVVGAEGVQPVRADGTVIESVGPPQLGFSWNTDASLGSLAITEGREPDRGEFVLDVGSAQRHGFEVGERYDVITPTGRHEVLLAGLVTFGENNDTLGAVLSAYPLADAQRMFDRVGQFDQIDIALDDDVNAATVGRSIASALPDHVEIVDAATLESEQAAEFNEGISLVGNVLLGFAIVSLFVSAFIIVNTFSMVLTQRTRELALLRAVGASSRQVIRSVLGEAAIVGAVAAAIGLLAGVGLAGGIRALFDASGAPLPASPIIVSPRTIVLAFLLGVGVTVLSSVAPARRAARTSPVSAMRASPDVATGTHRRRTVTGGTLALSGTMLGATGLFGALSTAATLAAIGVGGAALFVGATMLAPTLVRPVTRFLGSPIERLQRTSGKLAVANAGRSPRRTATTSASLMVGLTLVSLALVVGQSVKAQLSTTLDTAVRADAVVTDQLENGIPADVTTQLETAPAFAAVSPFRDATARVDGEVIQIEATRLDVVDSLLSLDLTAGATGTSAQLLVHEDLTRNGGYAVGDLVVVEAPSGATGEAEIAGVFSNQLIVASDFLIDLSIFEQLFPTAEDSFVLLDAAPAVSAAELEATLETLRATHPQLAIDSAASFRESAEETIDAALMVVNALLALALLIALLGIANTLALSVHERTREFGVMRAVGMTRRQLRRAVRWEAVLIAAFGATLGVTLGIGIGAAVVAALPETITSTLSVPIPQVITVAVVASAAGLLAAVLPARRAGRLDVLEAIRT